MDEANQPEPGQYAPPPKNLVWMQVATWTTSHWKTLVASLACLGIGLSLPLLFSEEEEVELVEEQSFIPTRLVATAVRRSEPISPLEPFENLDEHLVRLGKELFGDSGLSYPSGTTSCATCHNVKNGGVEPNAVRQPASTEHYNTPTIFNAGLNVVLHWEGVYNNLEEQLDAPIQDPKQMNTTWERIEKYVRSQRKYRVAFQEKLGAPPNERLIRQALAAYIRYLVGSGSRFDQWLAGEEMVLTTDELSGYLSFRKLNCVSCHQGALVGGSMVQRLGPLKEYFENQRELVESDYGRYNVTKEESDKFVFRVPSLRTAASTAPYFHDGSARTLEDAITAMIEAYTDSEPNAEVVRRIALFIRTLEAAPPELEAKAKIELEIVEEE